MMNKMKMTAALACALLTSGVAFAQLPAEVTAKFNEAAELINQKKFAEAIPMLETVLSEGETADPESDIVTRAQSLLPECYIRKGAMAAGAGKFEDAIAALNQADELAEKYSVTAAKSKINNLFPKVYIAYGAPAFNSKDYAKAIDIFSRAYTKFPNDTKMAMLLAQSYCASGDMAKGQEIYMSIIALADKHDKYTEAANQAKSELAGYMLEDASKAAAENDEALMEKFFDSGTLTEDEMREGIRKGLVTRSIFPLFCVCAGKDMGVRRLMEFLGNVVPFVSDMPKVKNDKGEEVPYDVAGKESIYFFKTSIEPHIGEVSYFKVMSGVLREGDDLLNVNRGSKERIAQLYVVDGSMRTKVSEMNAGDLGATVKLKDVKTGNTLDGKDCDYKFDFVKYPNSKYTRAIKPVNESEMEKMMAALNKMREEDPTWVVEQSKELRQTLVHGQGEFHLRTLKWRLENNEKIAVNFEEQKIPYRETITKAARADYRHKKQSGGAGQFGEVHLIVEPYKEGMPLPETYKFNGQEYKITVKGQEEVSLEWGGKLVFINSVVGGAIDARFMPAILKGIMGRMERGPLTGSYARDVRVIVYDGKMHPVDSNEISFMLAGRNAFSEAFRNAGPKILEPIYDVEIFVPSDKMGDVMSDLQGRRALIMGMDSEKGYEKLSAKVPLKEMASYSTALSSLTGGRASFAMKFASYELVPSDIQDKLIKEFVDEE